MFKEFGDLYTGFLFLLGIAIIAVGVFVLLKNIGNNGSFSEKYGVPLLIGAGVFFVYLSINPGASFQADIAGNKFVVESQLEKRIVDTKNAIEKSGGDAIQNVSADNQKSMARLQEAYASKFNEMSRSQDELKERIVILARAMDSLKATGNKVSAELRAIDSAADEKKARSLVIEIPEFNAVDLQDKSGDEVGFEIKGLVDSSILRNSGVFPVSSPGRVEVGGKFVVPLSDIKGDQYVLKMKIKWKGSWIYFGNDYYIPSENSQYTHTFEYSGWLTDKKYEVRILTQVAPASSNNTGSTATGS